MTAVLVFAATLLLAVLISERADLAELALFSVLFTDGMQVGVKDLTSAWRLPGRAILLKRELPRALFCAVD